LIKTLLRRRPQLISHSPNQPPTCWFRAERERKQRIAEEQAELDLTKSEKPHAQKVVSQTFSGEPSKFFLPAEGDTVEEMLAFAERAARLEALRRAPDRPTRASHLKHDNARRLRDSLTLQGRREKLNADLRKERERHQTERLLKAIGKLNPDMTLIRQAQMRKEELREAGERWKEWLQLTDQTNETRGTMLERLFLQHEIMSNLQVQLPNET
jgi:hypothetical protein